MGFKIDHVDEDGKVIFDFPIPCGTHPGQCKGGAHSKLKDKGIVLGCCDRCDNGKKCTLDLHLAIPIAEEVEDDEPMEPAHNNTSRA